MPDAGPEKAETNEPRGRLDIANVAKSFGSVAAVDNVSFTAQAGLITGLIGPNGAGKTTLFDSIAGEQIIDAGSVTLDGIRIDGKPPHAVFRHGLARTFQIPRPFPKMTVLENLLVVPMDQYGERFWNSWIRRGDVARQEAALREKARGVIDFCRLSAVENQAAGAISGGQQKLVEIARALMSDPRIILLDEPGAGVNPVLLDIIVDRIRELNRGGMTFLIIEHNIDFVSSLCDHLVVMAEGANIAEGTVPQVMARDDVIEAYLGGNVA